MQFQELLNNYPDDEMVVNRIIELYPDMDGSQGGFYEILPGLRTRKPTKSKYLICLEPVKDPDGDYISVSGELVNPDEDDEFVHYALDFTPWDEWLGMRVHPSALMHMSNLDNVCHILWEMTWHGFDEDKIQEEGQNLLDIVKDIEKEHGETTDSE